MMKCFRSYFYPAVLWLLIVLRNGYADIYEVITTADEGDGSLRQAMIDADNHAGPDTIQFNISESGSEFNGTVWIIRPQSQLPVLSTDDTMIDGFSQARNRNDTNPDRPEIMLNGSEAGENANGLQIQGRCNTVVGMIISGFDRYGIWLTTGGSSKNLIYGNFIGTTQTGREALPN